MVAVIWRCVTEERVAARSHRRIMNHRCRVIAHHHPPRPESRLQFPPVAFRCRLPPRVGSHCANLWVCRPCSRSAAGKPVPGSAVSGDISDVAFRGAQDVHVLRSKPCANGGLHAENLPEAKCLPGVAVLATHHRPSQDGGMRANLGLRALGPDPRIAYGDELFQLADRRTQRPQRIHSGQTRAAPLPLDPRRISSRRASIRGQVFLPRQSAWVSSVRPLGPDRSWQSIEGTVPPREPAKPLD